MANLGPEKGLGQKHCSGQRHESELNVGKRDTDLGTRGNLSRPAMSTPYIEREDTVIASLLYSCEIGDNIIRVL